VRRAQSRRLESFYVGQSLGILGSVTTALRSDIKAAVLNVPGSADILRRRRCRSGARSSTV
jgi:hypothetical protein